MDHGASPNIADCAGRTALIVAQNVNDPVIATSLLDHAADPLAVARNGTTTLGGAGDLFWQPVAIAAMLSHPRFAFDPATYGSELALARLTGWAFEAEVRILLDGGVDPDAGRLVAHQGPDAITPIRALAIPPGWPPVSLTNAQLDAMLDLLAAHGANLNANGQAVALAALTQYIPLLEKLLARGADPNTPDSEGRTALFYALRSDSYDRAQYDRVTSLLLRHGADVNVRTNGGVTVLIYTFLAPFVSPGEHPYYGWSNAYRSVVERASDETLFARVAGRNVVHFALKEYGRDFNYADASTKPAEHLRDEMERRLLGQSTLCHCEAFLAGVGTWEEVDSDCDVALRRVRGSSPSLATSFTDDICWPERAE